MGVWHSLRPTALPALLLLGLWPVFMLLPARYARMFFIVSGLALLIAVEGPLIAGGIAVAALAGYALTEAVSRVPRRPAAAFLAGLAALHAVYWACFLVPWPSTALMSALRPNDRVSVTIFFSGVAATFLRLVSYYCDRGRGQTARVGLADFLAYMLFFPQLRHGPIERCGLFHRRLLVARRAWEWRAACAGLLRIGLALLVLKVLAQSAAVLLARYRGVVPVDVMVHPETLSFGQLMLLIHLPGVLLYAAESSFAQLALGVSRVFGVRGTENFRYPFLARSPREVWHRWNITVSGWLRDYVYVPLGGRERRSLNILLTFAYCGLLHGLQWRTLLWGVWSGVTLAASVWLGEKWATWLGERFRQGRNDAAQPRTPVLALLLSLPARLLTFHVFSLGVVIILDPQYCGWRVFRRYLELLVSPLLG